MNRQEHLWMHWLRGLAIVLVVLFHVEVNVRYYMDTPEWLLVVNNAAAPLRMPAMMFLSGLLVERSLAKGAGTYLSGKLRRILWPYVLWSVIMGALLVVATGEHWGIIPAAVISPIRHLWFLYYLLGFYVVSLLLREASRWVPLAVAVLVAAGGQIGGADEFKRLGYLGAFFFAGVLVSRQPVVFRPRSWPAWVKTAGVVGLMVSLCAGAVLGDVRYEAYMGPLVGVGIAGAAWLASLSTGRPGARALEYVGRHSMVFYLVHYPAALLSVVVLMRFTDASLVVIVAGFVFALAASWVAAVLAERWAVVGALFAWPTARMASVASQRKEPVEA